MCVLKKQLVLRHGSLYAVRVLVVFATEAVPKVRIESDSACGEADFDNIAIPQAHEAADTMKINRAVHVLISFVHKNSLVSSTPM